MPQYTIRDMSGDGSLLDTSTASFTDDDEAVHFCVARLKSVPQASMWIELRQDTRMVATVVADGHMDTSLPSEGGEAASMTTAGYWEASMRGSGGQDAGLRPHDHGSAEPPRGSEGTPPSDNR